MVGGGTMYNIILLSTKLINLLHVGLYFVISDKIVNKIYPFENVLVLRIFDSKVGLQQRSSLLTWFAYIFAYLQQQN